MPIIYYKAELRWSHELKLKGDKSPAKEFLMLNRVQLGHVVSHEGGLFVAQAYLPREDFVVCADRDAAKNYLEDFVHGFLRDLSGE